jgi:uncharacterized membrane protein HdeD (DUF308 family)
VLGIITGVVFLVLGAFVALRPLWTHAPPLTSARWLDAMLAFVLLLRGVINIRTSIARRRAMATGS